MTREQFNQLVDVFIGDMQKKLGVKRAEYATDSDVFANFNKASKVRNRAREAIAFDYALKHLVSIIDIIEEFENGYKDIPDGLILEKFTDFANYLVLIYAMNQEHTSKKEG